MKQRIQRLQEPGVLANIRVTSLKQLSAINISLTDTAEHLNLKKWKWLFHVDSAVNNQTEIETLQVASRRARKLSFESLITLER